MNDYPACGGLVDPSTILDLDDCDLLLYPVDIEKMRKLIDKYLPEGFRP
ncbi:MAG: hypothetical protein WC455_12520 [Dehalococcoidia bacterium]|jgi:hypothetical protein